MIRYPQSGPVKGWTDRLDPSNSSNVYYELSVCLSDKAAADALALTIQQAIAISEETGCIPQFES